MFSCFNFELILKVIFYSDEIDEFVMVFDEDDMGVKFVEEFYNGFKW